MWVIMSTAGIDHLENFIRGGKSEVEPSSR